MAIWLLVLGAKIQPPRVSGYSVLEAKLQPIGERRRETPFESDRRTRRAKKIRVRKYRHILPGLGSQDPTKIHDPDTWSWKPNSNPSANGAAKRRSKAIVAR